MEIAIEWRTIDEPPNYEVSSSGQVRNRTSHVILSAERQYKGYLRVQLWRDGHRQHKLVHQLVAAAFLGPADGRQVDHIDRNPANNHIENLRYVSSSGNQKNKKSHHGVQYEYVDALPEGAIVVDDYNGHDFEDLHYHGGNFYFYNAVQYRVLHRNRNSRVGSYSVYAVDTSGVTRSITISAYQRFIGEI
jgi:hypothetical protein